MTNEITDETIEYVSILSKLELSGKEREQAKNDLAKMMDYLGQLRDVDTSEAGMPGDLSREQAHLREDVVANKDDKTAMLQNAPETKDGMFVVPRTFGTE